MKPTKHTDLSHEIPSPRADLLIYRQRVIFKCAGWFGLRAQFGLEHETEGPSGAAGAAVAMAAAAVPAVVISAVGVVAGAPGWLTVTLAAAVFTLYIIIEMVFVERQRRTALARVGATAETVASGSAAPESSKKKAKKRQRKHQKKR